MKLRMFCSKVPSGLTFSLLGFLLPSITTGRNPDHIYFSNSAVEIVLGGPVNPENGEYVLKWKPHSGQRTQKLLTFSKGHWSSWKAVWNDHLQNSDFYQAIRQVHGTISTKIINPTFSLAGLYTLIQLQPKKQILKQYNVFGLKVEASPQQPVVGSDVTLSCTISKLPDTVSLHWEPMGSSQQNRKNSDQIHLNNTLYLMVRHVTVEDGKLYECQVRENGDIVLTSRAEFPVTDELYQSRKTMYRSGTDHSELHLNCYLRRDYSFNYAEWTWSSHLHQIQNKEIATALRSSSVSVDTTYFRKRIETTRLKFNGNDFSGRIVPVLFEDAGDYKCYMDSHCILTIKLVTAKVTAEPSDAAIQGDTINLTCSVSEVIASMKLVWINADKAVGEKMLKSEEKSMSLIIQEADRDRWNWKCGLFYQNRPQLLVPYYLGPSGSRNYIYFFHEEGSILLKGPDNTGNGPIVWEWRPHSGLQTAKQLATFHREDQQWAVQWSDEYNKIPGISQRMHADWGTLNLRVRNPTFEFAGLFTWIQTQPSEKILRQWEIFGIKVEADSQRPVVGSDITLSFTISRLPDTISLHWKPRGSSQQNRSNNTDQIHLNNTVYLMVRHVGTGNPNPYTWEVQEKDSIVLTGDTSVEVDQDLHKKVYTIYRSDTNHSELDLICEAFSWFTKTKWTWRSQHFQNQEKEIASIHISKPINVTRSYFGNRLRTTVGYLNGKNFSVRIVPVWFEDAGVYTCSTESYEHVTMELITVKVTAEPPDAVTEGDTVTLTCSVSDVTEPVRLVWIDGDDKTVEAETFMEQRQEEKSLQLVIPKADGERRKWLCGLFHQNTPKILIPYWLKVKKDYRFKHTTVVIIGSLALLFIIILVIVLRLRKFKLTGLGKQKQSEGNVQDEPHLYSNAGEIHQIQGGNEKQIPKTSHNAEYMSVSRKSKNKGANKSPDPETSHFAEYSTVKRKPRQEETQEDIHYGSISFQRNASGHRRISSANQPSNINLVSSKEDDSSVIYAQIAQTEI